MDSSINIMQLREVEEDLNCQEDIEVYVRHLADEYIDNFGCRRTKLFQKIESYYQKYPLVKAIAESYSMCFVQLDSNHTKRNRKSAHAVIRDIYRKFPESEQIAEDYAYFLMMESYELNEAECREFLNIVQSIYDSFQKNEDIEESLRVISENLGISEEHSKVVAHKKQMELEICSKPDSKEVVKEYVAALSEYADYAEEDECNNIKDTVLKYCNQFEGEAFFQYSYAKIIVSIMAQADEQTVMRLFREVRNIYELNPSLNMAIVYADALNEVLDLQNAVHSEAFEEIEKLYKNYSNDSTIIAAFAWGLYSLIEIQDNERAKKTLSRLSQLAQENPKNSEVQDGLKQAKARLKQKSVLAREEKINTNCFAVLDTETTWDGNVMTIGIVIADRVTFSVERLNYYIIEPEVQLGGMFAEVVSLPSEEITKRCSRKEAIQDIYGLFRKHGVDSIFAYNVSFDKNKLPELKDYSWLDIMDIAAIKKYNPSIPQEAECFKTGRLKSGYGLEKTAQRLSGNSNYHEMHNALFDAMDELKVMEYLGYTLDSYSKGEKPIKKSLDIGKNNKKLRVGDRINHRIFGSGIVLNCSEKPHNSEGSFLATVSFINRGTKMLLFPYNDMVWREI